MSDNLSRLYLDSRGNEFILQQIIQSEFTQTLKNMNELSRLKAWTIVPQSVLHNANETILYSFDVGGLIASYSLESDKTLEELYTPKKFLADFIYNSASRKQDLYCYIESLTLNARDIDKRPDINAVVVNKAVLHKIDTSNLSTTYISLKKYVVPRASIGLVVSQVEPYSNLSESSAICIFVPAYDGDSFVVIDNLNGL